MRMLDASLISLYGSDGALCAAYSAWLNQTPGRSLFHAEANLHAYVDLFSFLFTDQ